MADMEVPAIRAAYVALEALSPSARERALTWLEARLEWEHRAGSRAAMAVAQFARGTRRLSRAIEGGKADAA